MTNDKIRNSKLNWKLSDWLILAGLLALVLLFHWRLITPNLADRQSYPPGDFSAQFWAFSTFEARQLSAGHLPLWNPYTFAGAPFWADAQGAVFYPFSLLTLALSGLTGGFSFFALELEAISHFWLAAIFMYLFARRVTQSRGAGLLSAVIFAFGGYLTGYPSQQLAVLEVDVWLPLILFFIDRAFLCRDSLGVASRAKPALRDLLLAGLAWGIALLAGHPQSWMLVGYTMVAYGVVVSSSPPPQPPVLRDGVSPLKGEGVATSDGRGSQSPISNRQSLITRMAWLALPIGLGFALAAVQLLPVAEYVRLSVRAAGVYDKMAGGFPLTDTIQLLLPSVVSQYSPLYVSGAGLLLAIGAIFWARNRFTAFWAGWGALALLIAFGGNTFLYSPLYLSAPGFSIFRGQERWAFVVAFSLAILAGYGAKQLFAGGMSGFRRLSGWFALGGIGLVIAFFYGLNSTGWSTESQFYTLLNRAVFLIIVLTLFWVIPRVTNKWSPKIFYFSLTALIIFDLFSVNWKTNLYPQSPAWHTQMPAAVRAIKTDAGEQNVFRVYNEFQLYDNYGVPFALQDIWGASPLRLARYEAFLAPPMRIERAWELLNVKYVITWRQELYAPSTIIFEEAAGEGMRYVHRLDNVAPRAWMVHRVEKAVPSAMIARLSDFDFNPRKVALVDETIPPDWRFSAPDSATIESADVIANDFDPNRFSVRANATADGLLVLSEIDYPGWHATVDGVATPITRVDSVLRGVPISAGTHKVEMRFEPLSFKVGIVVSLIALLIFVGGMGLSFSSRMDKGCF